MNPVEQAERIVDRMYENDSFTRRMGMERLEILPGRCILRLTVSEEMLNGFGIAHGGVTYCLADSALAFASNSRGRQAVSVETSISHLVAVQPGEVLTATATEESLSHRIGLYRVEVRNQEDRLVALFKGVVYRTEKEWNFP